MNNYDFSGNFSSFSGIDGVVGIEPGIEPSWTSLKLVIDPDRDVETFVFGKFVKMK